MRAYCRGTHPGALTNVMLSGINVPIRIGDAIVMPGDIVLGDRRREGPLPTGVLW